MTTRKIRTLIYDSGTSTTSYGYMAGYKCEACLSYTRAYTPLSPDQIKHQPDCFLTGIKPEIEVHIP